MMPLAGDVFQDQMAFLIPSCRRLDLGWWLEATKPSWISKKIFLTRMSTLGAENLSKLDSNGITCYGGPPLLEIDRPGHLCALEVETIRVKPGNAKNYFKKKRYSKFWQRTSPSLIQFHKGTVDTWVEI